MNQDEILAEIYPKLLNRARFIKIRDYWNFWPEDLVQEAYLRARKAGATFEHPGQAYAYLDRAMTAAAYDRNRRRQNGYKALAFQLFDIVEDGDPSPWTVDPTNLEDQTIAKMELDAILDEATRTNREPAAVLVAQAAGYEYADMGPDLGQRPNYFRAIGFKWRQKHQWED